MILTKRQGDILIYLCSQRDYITINQLALKFNVSPRTIQNDLGFIDSFLSGSKVIVDRKSSKGIKINAGESEISYLRKKLKSLNYRTLNSDERSSIIELLLLCNPVNTFDQLSHACRVSRQTIITSFQKIEDKFKKEEIEIQKTKGMGIKLSGNELKIRKCFENRLSELVSNEIIMNIVIENTRLMEFDKTANEIINSVENKLNIKFAEFIKIKLLLNYSLLRISNGNVLFSEKENTDMKKIKIYKEYNYIISALSNYPYSTSDKFYFCSLFMNAKRTVQYSNNSKMHENNIDEASIISEYLFNELQAIQPLDINSKERFIRGLTLHLRVAIYRIRNKIDIRNELLDQIKISIPIIYEFTKKELLKCEKKFNLEFDENEIAFIAMYIASAYENSFKIESKLTVLLVCSFGISTSSILNTRILQAIPECKIVGPISEKDVEDYLQKNEVNLIISTNDYQIDDIPIIKVNPLLYPEDVEYIKNRLFQLSYSMMSTHFIRSYANFEKGKKKPTYIKDYIARENIQIVDTCKTWADAIRLASKPLLDKGKIEQRYVNRMIQAVEQFGTYMVLVPETAFIHAGTKDGINENCAAMLVLKNPILFGNKNIKIVRNLVVLGIKNKNEDSLLKLIYIFENKFNLLNLKSKKISIDIIFNMHD
ncbi:BglG family transcription antiterminator [Acidilutibacter cellobiosedens]|nr:BglG family transcription antiterminator [Acidilutibacter cellobiosedens]